MDSSLLVPDEKLNESPLELVPIEEKWKIGIYADTLNLNNRLTL